MYTYSVLYTFKGLSWWSVVKTHLPMQETWVQALGQGDLLEKEMVIHSSILAWRIPWTEESGNPIDSPWITKSQRLLSD